MHETGLLTWPDHGAILGRMLAHAAPRFQETYLCAILGAVVSSACNTGHSQVYTASKSNREDLEAYSVNDYGRFLMHAPPQQLSNGGWLTHNG